MSGLIECQKTLLDMAKDKGYLTFEDVLDSASTFLLSLSDIDRLSNNLQSLGVLLYESEPEQLTNEADDTSDYSRTDYASVFAEIVSLSENTAPLVDMVRDVPPPQFGEVQSLAEQLQFGNDYARERLIMSHLRVALKIALAIAKQYSYDIEDAVSASLIGLMEAVERFDPNGFSAFQSYASMWIQQNIHRYCNPVWMQHYCPFHIKEKMYSVLLKYNHNCGTIIEENSFDAHRIQTIAEELDFKTAQVERYLQFAYNQAFGRIDIDAIDDEEPELGWEVDDDYLFETQAFFTSEEVLFDRAAHGNLRRLIEEMLGGFAPRDQEIIRLRFGLDGDNPKTLEEIGQMYNITRERVRQIENKSICRMRHPSRAKRLRDFYY